MARIDVLDILRTKKQTPLEFDFDNLWIPPMHVYLSQDDVESLRRIATSLRLSSKIELKYKMIDDIMRNRGFKRFSAGTNRVVYSFLEDTRFVVKIAVDRVGMQDNPMEYENQAFLKPYCTKMFYISPCGTVGFAERVLPIKNRREFKEIAPDVFEILVNKILGKYVMEDVGTKYFMNYGVRPNDGPVLLDYPFIYKLDGKKIFCNKIHPTTKEPCNGEIDYDEGFNHLVCTRCGKIYLATDLKDDSIDNKIIIKGGIQMKIMLKKGDEIISTPVPVDDVMVRPKKKPEYKSNGLVVKISGGCIKEPKEEISNPPIVEDDKPEKEENVEIIQIEGTTEASVDVEVTPAEETDNTEKTPDVEVNEGKEIDFHVESNFIVPKEEDTSTDKKAEEKSTKNEKKPTSKKTSSSKQPTKKSSKVENTIKDDDKNAEDDDKYAVYDTDDSPAYQPIRKKKNSVERDKNGRFVSSGKKKSGPKSSTRIPSK